MRVEKQGTHTQEGILENACVVPTVSRLSHFSSVSVVRSSVHVPSIVPNIVIFDDSTNRL